MKHYALTIAHAAHDVLALIFFALLLAALTVYEAGCTLLNPKQALRDMEGEA